MHVAFNCGLYLPVNSRFWLWLKAESQKQNTTRFSEFDFSLSYREVANCVVGISSSWTWRRQNWNNGRYHQWIQTSVYSIGDAWDVRTFAQPSPGLRLSQIRGYLQGAARSDPTAAEIAWWWSHSRLGEMQAWWNFSPGGWEYPALVQINKTDAEIRITRNSAKPTSTYN